MRAFELRPPDARPMSQEHRARIKATRPQLIETALKRYGLEFNPGPVGVDSRPALIGSKFAKTLGLQEVYNKAVYAAYWLEGKKIDDPSILSKIAQEVGLNGDEFLNSLCCEALEGEVLAEISKARAQGLRGVPAMIFDGKLTLVGAQPEENIKQALEVMMAEKD